MHGVCLVSCYGQHGHWHGVAWHMSEDANNTSTGEERRRKKKRKKGGGTRHRLSFPLPLSFLFCFAYNQTEMPFLEETQDGGARSGVRAWCLFEGRRARGRSASHFRSLNARRTNENQQPKKEQDTERKQYAYDIPNELLFFMAY